MGSASNDLVYCHKREQRTQSSVLFSIVQISNGLYGVAVKRVICKTNKRKIRQET